jgi:hypothetical protein
MKIPPEVFDLPKKLAYLLLKQKMRWGAVVKASIGNLGSRKLTTWVLM